MKQVVFWLVGALMAFQSSVGNSASSEQTINIPPIVYELKKDLESILFPKIKPYNEGYLKVSDLHEIWYAQYGNPKGVPVLVVHGGPGAGYSSNDMRFFDPSFYQIILFDQRGAMRSRPFGEMKENTTQLSINDMEKLRVHLNVQKWLLFGGSWGSALSLAYGEMHPKNSLGFILRGVFLATEPEFKQLWYGMRDTFPEAWDEMAGFLSENERKDLISAYDRRLKNPDPQIHLAAARKFMKYDLISAFAIKMPPIETLLADDKVVLGIARTFTHYCTQKFFLKENQLMDEVGKIQHLPGFIVQGRFDTICRAKTAYELHRKWPGSKLTFVQDAGHSAAEPGIAKALVEATEKVKGNLSIP